MFPDTPQTEPSENGPAIFTVDDEEIIGAMIGAIFKSAGFTYKTFKDPLLLLETFRNVSPKPKIIITDYFMGTMTGLELIERCRQVDPTVKTILLSGTVGEDFVHQHSTQPDRFLPKPFRTKELLETVQGLLRAHA